MAKHKAVFLQMSTIGLDYEEIYQLAKVSFVVQNFSALTHSLSLSLSLSLSFGSPS